MSISVKNRSLYDTRTGTEFGPKCLSDDEAHSLLSHIWHTLGKSPIECDATERMLALSEIRSTYERPKYLTESTQKVKY